jgi:hypothetical protein
MSTMLLASGRNFKRKALQLLKSKAKGEATLIVTLILISIAVGLCLYFRTEILGVMTSAMDTLGTTITTMLTEAT